MFCLTDMYTYEVWKESNIQYSCIVSYKWLKLTDAEDTRVFWVALEQTKRRIHKKSVKVTKLKG